MLNGSIYKRAQAPGLIACLVMFYCRTSIIVGLVYALFTQLYIRLIKTTP